MAPRLHWGGRFRTWLGARLGGDFALGDRVWRRVLHGLGAVVLVYYALPDNFFLIAPKADILVAALVVVLLLEILRHVAGLELPTIRAYEARRVGSFALFGTAIVATILFFPMPIAAAVVLGTAIVDPLAGELRLDPRGHSLDLLVPFVAYALLAFAGLALLGRWPVSESAVLASVAAALGVAVERPKVPWYDDDLAMMLVPALALYALARFVFGLPV
jgi:hypothetical protein